MQHQVAKWCAIHLRVEKRVRRPLQPLGQRLLQDDVFENVGAVLGGPRPTREPRAPCPPRGLAHQGRPAQVALQNGGGHARGGAGAVDAQGEGRQAADQRHHLRGVLVEGLGAGGEPREGLLDGLQPGRPVLRLLGPHLPQADLDVLPLLLRGAGGRRLRLGDRRLAVELAFQTNGLAGCLLELPVVLDTHLLVLEELILLLLQLVLEHLPLEFQLPALQLVLHLCPVLRGVALLVGHVGDGPAHLLGLRAGQLLLDLRPRRALLLDRLAVLDLRS
mmetsp:Transcript_28568/g.86280  ORF Transcript_28568/g.86280 Transcript_28568/m.86280 type:complete len:276 (-) Transcript_28568:209-1036(-)